ncbi:hypothetical protein D1155_10925 [Anaerotruncus sp. 80]|jgi:hypothetical protein|uniref:Uncharacterized protein n=1 Tax=Anaerotruncus colihominis TaxID=169435 RepID=A0A845QL56_9FIRM|nr:MULTISPECIES: hypothetical protein [Clostridia]NBH62164.1 hypothetical protein [Anaerotruncus colihominis]NCE99650.1 hypothetical protein [Emergencia sp. 1XD21-10]NCF02819.1 hypothetical protein [Anaerotruncus sp. 80]
MIVVSICADCKHFNHDEKVDDSNKKYTCGAFPDGIPLEFVFRTDKDSRCSETVNFEPEE